MTKIEICNVLGPISAQLTQTEIVFHRLFEAMQLPEYIIVTYPHNLIKELIKMFTILTYKLGD